MYAYKFQKLVYICMSFTFSQFILVLEANYFNFMMLCITCNTFVMHSTNELQLVHGTYL